MPRILGCGVAGLVLVLVTGCGGDDNVAALPGSGSTPALTAAPPEQSPPEQSPPEQSPPEQTPPVADSVPGACSLVTEEDLVAVTAGIVELEFVGEPEEVNDESFFGGASSVCRRALRSTWSEAGGSATVDGVVTVQLQASGAVAYFPATGEEMVPGIGDEAFRRGDELYVRIGVMLAVLRVGISTPDPDGEATRLEWAKTLATQALSRL